MLRSPELPKEAVPEAPWGTVLDAFQTVWQQGQHLTLLGRTGGGKTTFAIQLLDRRRYVAAILTKRDDPLYKLLRKRGYWIGDNLDDRPSPQGEHGRHIAFHLRPDGLGRRTNEAQAEKVSEILHRLWEEKGWTIYLDEIASLTDLLKLDTELRSLWKEARSSKISLVCATQRPARIPLEAYSQPRWLVLWRTSDREELRRLAGMNGVDPEPVRAVVSQLGRHEVLIVDTQTGELVRTQPPALAGAAKR